MRNCVIVGSGRSGSSLAAGALSNTGCYEGRGLVPPRDANPTGFFEDREVNRINEELLATVTQKRPSLLWKWWGRNRPGFGQRWLARVPLQTPIESSPLLDEQIQDCVRQQPYCLKDPRFSYTLPLWRPWLNDAAFICTFRDPATTVNSMLKEVATVEYMKHFRISIPEALEVWRLMYQHIVRIHANDGDWLFVHYEQLLNRQGIRKIGQLTGATVDSNFANPDLNRSKQHREIPPDLHELYAELCDLAEYQVAA